MDAVVVDEDAVVVDEVVDSTIEEAVAADLTNQEDLVAINLVLALQLHPTKSPNSMIKTSPKINFYFFQINFDF